MGAPTGAILFHLAVLAACFSRVPVRPLAVGSTRGMRRRRDGKLPNTAPREIDYNSLPHRFGSQRQRLRELPAAAALCLLLTSNSASRPAGELPSSMATRQALWPHHTGFASVLGRDHVGNWALVAQIGCRMVPELTSSFRRVLTNGYGVLLYPQHMWFLVREEWKM